MAKERETAHDPVSRGPKDRGAVPTGVTVALSTDRQEGSSHASRQIRVTLKYMFAR